MNIGLSSYSSMKHGDRSSCRVVLVSILISILTCYFLIAGLSCTTTSMVEIDWSKCRLCQKITEESLTSPGGNLRKGDAGARYRTLANNILRFFGDLLTKFTL